MASKVVNLNKFRKKKQREEKEKQAEINRIRHGRTKAEKSREHADRERAARLLEGKRLDHGTEPTYARIRALLAQLRADPKLAPIVAAYEADATKPGRAFGKNGLKTGRGKLFALFTQGTLVVKLPRERVEALVERGVGKPFNPGHGRLMKEWLAVTSTNAAWGELAKEAWAFVDAGERVPS